MRASKIASLPGLNPATNTGSPAASKNRVSPPHSGSHCGAIYHSAVSPCSPGFASVCVNNVSPYVQRLQYARYNSCGPRSGRYSESAFIVCGYRGNLLQSSVEILKAQWRNAWVSGRAASDRVKGEPFNQLNNRRVWFSGIRPSTTTTGIPSTAPRLIRSSTTVVLPCRALLHQNNITSTDTEHP